MMPDIIIKDEFGNPDVYEGVNTVKFKTPDDQTVSFKYNPGTEYPYKDGDYRVRFLDYDGEVLNVQWVDAGDAAVYPSRDPQHPGLTFLGWNYSLASLSEINGNVDVMALYFATAGGAEPGQYSSENSNIFEIRILPNSKSCYLRPYYSGSVTWVIDWGDGTVETKSVTNGSTSDAGSSTTYSHTYADAGEYTVTMTKTAGTGSYWFGYFGASSSASYNICGNNNSACFLSAVLDGGIEKMGSSAFYGLYSISTVVLPPAVRVPDSWTSAFYNCYSLQNASIPDSVTSIGSNAFYNCTSLQNVSIPDSVTSIGSGAFQNCNSLQNVSIPDSVTSIGSGAFFYCTSLQNASIPDSVTSIGSSAFSNCYALHDIYLSSVTPPTLGSSGISSNANWLIHVPAAAVQAYKAAANWSSYANNIVGY